MCKVNMSLQNQCDGICGSHLNFLLSPPDVLYIVVLDRVMHKVNMSVQNQCDKIFHISRDRVTRKVNMSVQNHHDQSGITAGKDHASNAIFM
jgi:hypothetical protein